MIVHKLHAARPRMWKKNDDVRVTKNDGRSERNLLFQKDCKLYVIFGEAKKLLQTLCQNHFFVKGFHKKMI